MNVTKEELLKNTVQGKLGELITGAEEIAKQAVEMMRTSSSLLVWGEAVKRMAEKENESETPAGVPEWTQRQPDWELVARTMCDAEVKEVFFAFQNEYQNRFRK